MSLPAVAAGLALLVMATAARDAGSSEAPRFRLPLDCRIGKTCSIQKYVDHDKTRAYSDYRCGPLSSDGHKGTDFRVSDFEAMRKGVAVLAAAPGTVQAIRNDMPDVSVSLVGEAAVTDRGLGNAVVIDHGGEWRSVYGHMRRGSVTVNPGDTVEAGDKLGLVGLSGLTNYPHVHFQVEHRGKVVDPFIGTGIRVGCAEHPEGLWRPWLASRMRYIPTFTMRAGIFNRPMTQPALQYGLYEETAFSRRHGKLYFAILVAGLYRGDSYRFRLYNAADKTLREIRETESRRRGVRLLQIALSRVNQLPPGPYRVHFTLTGTRDGKRQVVLDETRELTLRP